MFEHLLRTELSLEITAPICAQTAPSDRIIHPAARRSAPPLSQGCGWAPSNRKRRRKRIPTMMAIGAGACYCVLPAIASVFSVCLRRNRPRMIHRTTALPTNTGESDTLLAPYKSQWWRRSCRACRRNQEVLASGQTSCHERGDLMGPCPGREGSELSANRMHDNVGLAAAANG